MKIILTFSLLVFCSLAAYASESRKPSSLSSDACEIANTNCEGTIGLPQKLAYTIRGNRVNLTFAGNTEFKNCEWATKAKKAFHFEDEKCHLISFGLMKNDEVTLNDTDGCYAYYKCKGMER